MTERSREATASSADRLLASFASEGGGMTGGTARITVGVAIDIPEPYGSVLDRCRAAAGDPLAPFIPAHVTLLGPTQVPGDALPTIEEHLAGVAAGSRAYRVDLHGTGTFRPVTEVVFVAVAGGFDDCVALAGAVRSGPLARDLAFPYHPHVTVAHDIPTSALDTVYAELSEFTAGFAVEHFTLYVHGPAGRWRPVRDFLLPGAPTRVPPVDR
jgi:2'-5' RNA ligase